MCKWSKTHKKPTTGMVDENLNRFRPKTEIEDNSIFNFTYFKLPCSEMLWQILQIFSIFSSYWQFVMYFPLNLLKIDSMLTMTLLFQLNEKVPRDIISFVIKKIKDSVSFLLHLINLFINFKIYIFWWCNLQIQVWFLSQKPCNFTLIFTFHS